jgi:hypothetical protein
MSEMFRKQIDQNGVEIDSNSHTAQSYGHPPSEQLPSSPHWMAGTDGRGGYMEPPAEGLIHKTKDRIIGGQGSRPGAMSFSGDLLPRSERLPRAEAGRGVEIHDANCWCDLCHPPMGTSAPNAAPTTYRK